MEKVLNKTDGLYYMQTRYKPATYTEYYNSRTRDVIANKFKVDIERFGYEFSK